VFDLGDIYPAALDVFDANSNLVNPSTVVLTITLPDATVVTPTVTNPPTVTGKLRYSYLTTMAGRHTVRWVTTAPNTAYTDMFTVAEADALAMMSLAEVKLVLGIDPSDTADDEEIRHMIQAVTVAIEDYKGQVMVRRSFTDDYEMTWPGRLRLQNTPVISLTALVSQDGTKTWDVTKLHVNKDNGIVTVLSGPPITGTVYPTYLAGFQVIPYRYIEAAKIILEHIWETRRGPGGVGGVIGPEELRDYKHTSDFPRKAREWLGPSQPVVA